MPIGARVRNKWGAKRSLSTRFEQTKKSCSPAPRSSKPSAGNAMTIEIMIKHQKFSKLMRNQAINAFDNGGRATATY